MNDLKDLSINPDQVIAEGKLTLAVRDLVRKMGRYDKVEISKLGNGKLAVSLVRVDRQEFDFS